MTQPSAYLAGRWISAADAVVHVSDAGFVLGVAVAEQLRTFGGKLFHLDDHLARLNHSLEIVGLDPRMTRDQLAETAAELVARNHPLLAPGDDLGLSIVVTPGSYATFAPPGPVGPTVCLHTYPLPFHLWADKYGGGQSLATTAVEQVPSQCWPTSLKCRSRMHYYLADRQARAIDRTARALMHDAEGFVTEASSANLLVFRADEGFISPPADKILHGISRSVAIDLAQRLEIPCSERDLTADDVAAADEVLLTSTSMCVLPVTRFNARPIATGRPGAVFHRLLAAWSDMVGIDIAAQAERFATRVGYASA